MLFQIANAFIRRVHTVAALAPWARWDLKVSRAFKACRDWRVSRDPRDARVEADSRDRKVSSIMFVFAKSILSLLVTYDGNLHGQL